MACKILSSGGAVFALWGRPLLADIDEVLSQVSLAAKASGRPIVYIARIPLDAPPPEGAARQRMDQAMPEFRAVCASYHVILEGGGFLSAVKRAMLAGLMQSGWPRDTFFVQASATQVASKAPRDYREDVEKILYLAEQQGLLSGPAPGELRQSGFGNASRA